MLTDITIKNFKCFDNFSAQGFKQVNLIGGKNNVGKTAFMEACYINVHSYDVKTMTSSMIKVSSMRNYIELLEGEKDNLPTVKNIIEAYDGLIFTSSIKNSIYYITDNNGILEYSFFIGGSTLNIKVNEFSFDKDFEYIIAINFISSFGISNENIIDGYSAVQMKDKEELFNEAIKKLDSSIEAFKIINNKPLCKIRGEYLPITDCGDGLRDLIAIISSIFKSEDGYLFIDEVGSGIHYTMLDELWKMILSLSKELNVQIFATTHSRESIESFNRVSKKFNDQSTYLEMARNKKTNEIFMRNIDNEQLSYELTHDGKFRGE